MKKVVSLVVVSGLAIAAPAMAQNGLFDFGNLVVSQVGAAGGGALSSAATVCSLREMTTAGAFTNDDALMPTVVSGLNRRVTMSGTATSEGFLTFATDYKSLCFQGYDAAPGTLNVPGTTAAAANRVFASVNLAMNIDSGTAFTDAYSTSNIRSSIMIGPTVYTSGSGSPAATGGVRSAAFGSVGPSILESGTLTNSRVVNAFAGSLYASSASGAFVGINVIAAGTATNVIATGAGSSPYDFLFTSATTCYIADDRTVASGGGLQKWTFSGTWSLAYTISTNLTAGLRSVTIDPATGTIFAISADSPSKLVSVIDGGSAATSPFATLAQAAANTQFRGVEFIAAPAPGSAVLLGLGGLLAVRRRR